MFMAEKAWTTSYMPARASPKGTAIKLNFEITEAVNAAGGRRGIYIGHDCVQKNFALYHHF